VVRVLVGSVGLLMPPKGSFYLVVRGDLFEVSNPFQPARLLGQQYCYRAQDTTVKVVAGLRHHWIEIDGQPPGTASRVTAVTRLPGVLGLPGEFGGP
jgi:hypothetical protein